MMRWSVDWALGYEENYHSDRGVSLRSGDLSLLLLEVGLHTDYRLRKQIRWQRMWTRQPNGRTSFRQNRINAVGKRDVRGGMKVQNHLDLRVAPGVSFVLHFTLRHVARRYPIYHPVTVAWKRPQPLALTLRHRVRVLNVPSFWPLKQYEVLPWLRPLEKDLGGA
jgi:hypothetical protein